MWWLLLGLFWIVGCAAPSERLSLPVSPAVQKPPTPTPSSPGFFPIMRGEFLVYPLSSSETQIELHGHYAPPLGLVGSALDAVAGHRLAEASVQRFVHAVAEHLRQRLQTG